MLTAVLPMMFSVAQFVLHENVFLLNMRLVTTVTMMIVTAAFIMINKTATAVLLVMIVAAFVMVSGTAILIVFETEVLLRATTILHVV